MSAATRARREASRLFEPLGYEYAGMNRNSHFVFTHPSGAVMRVGRDLNGRKRQNYLSLAKRNIGYTESTAQRFVRFVHEQFNVGDHDQRDVEFQMGTMVGLFKAAYPDTVGWTSSGPNVAIKSSPLITLLGGGAGGTVSRYRLTGRLYGVNDDERSADDLAVGGEPAREPRVVGVGDQPVVAVGQDVEAVGVGAEADDAAVVDDPVVDEPDRPDPHALTISPELAQQLRDVLGGGDLEAEVVLLRETLQTVLGSLQNASQAVEAALSLRSLPDRPIRRGYKLGSKRVRQLKMLRDAGITGLMTSENTAPILGESPKNAGNALWSLGSAGALTKTARGVYEWPEEAS